MKYNKYMKSALAFAAGLALASGCRVEEDFVATAVQTKETSVIFDAKDAVPQVISVYADGQWAADVSEDWLEVSPMSGDKNTEVTVTVLSDNVDEKGNLCAPREAILTFRGSSVERQGLVYVTQKGDTYLGIGEYTVSEAAALEDGSKAKISSAKVAAVSAKGFVITDGTTDMYVEGARDLKAGDNIFLTGEKARTGGFPSFKADEVEVLSSEEFKYPAPVEINGALETSNPGKVAYVKVSGTVIGDLLRVENANNGKILDAPDALELSKVNIHKVELAGYYVGLIDGLFSFVATGIKDNGADNTVGEPLPFKDDFSWLTPFIEAANAVLDPAKQISDCVGSVLSSADGAANIYTTLADNNIAVLETLRSRGYKDLNPGMKTIYLQDAYLKYGAGNKQSGLSLPLFKMDGEQDIVVSFKWCAQIGGSGAVDKTALVLEIDGPGTIVTSAGAPDTKVSDPVSSTQKTGEMFWQDAMFRIEGVTTATTVSFHPSVFGSEENPESGYYRYYLDDLEVMLAADAVQANIAIEGVENNLITFEGTPDAPVTFNVSSDVDFSVTSSAKWLKVENGEGFAGETKSVTVTCDPSDLNVMRKAEISIKSGITVKKIQVVQSSAGQEIAPFISVVGGNSMDVIGEKSAFDVKVQANVAVAVDVSSGSDWITYTPAAGTKALVETASYSFSTIANLTGAPRKGIIRFFNEENGLESILTVSQENFEPRIDADMAGAYKLGAFAGSYSLAVDANVDFTASSDASWISFPAVSGKAGSASFKFDFAANASGSRSAKIVFTNDEYGLRKEVTVEQFESGYWFTDDFGWMSGLFGTTAVGSSVEDNNPSGKAPNVYTDKGLIASGIMDVFTEYGYVDLNPSKKVLYPQDTYWKMSKTDVVTGLMLPVVAGIDTPTDIVISFKWAAHRRVLNAGKDNETFETDPVRIVVDMVKDVILEDIVPQAGGATVKNVVSKDIVFTSGELESSQPLDKMEWQYATVTLKGFTSDMRIQIRPTSLYNASFKGLNRWYIDNIEIVPAN